MTKTKKTVMPALPRCVRTCGPKRSAMPHKDGAPKKGVKPSSLTIVMDCPFWKRLRGLRRELETATALTLACLPEKFFPLARQARVTLLLTDDKGVKALNHDFRGLNRPTNVLSFPQIEAKDLVKEGKRAQSPLSVGDIAIAYGVVLKESQAEGKTVPDHVTHLLIHGLLHLFGYDHDTPRRAGRMERLERTIMATLGRPDPYGDEAVNRAS